MLEQEKQSLETQPKKSNIKYSIVTCAYDNPDQFKNFLLTAMNQDCHDKYEVVIVDNGTPNSSIFDACYNFSGDGNGLLGYMRIDPSEKKTKNITQGINTGARAAIGDYLVIISDSNVLLSYNLLSKIDEVIDENMIVTSTGCDIKLSPEGTHKSEYSNEENKAIINRQILSVLGWPKDPMAFSLDLVSHRYPWQHGDYDVYMVAMDRKLFLQEGGYLELDGKWGKYHYFFVKKLCTKYVCKRLYDIRIIHQYHGIHWGAEIESGHYSEQFKIMRCRKT